MENKRTKYAGLHLLVAGKIDAGVQNGARSWLPDKSNSAGLPKEPVSIHDDFPKWFQRHIDLLDHGSMGNVFTLKVK